MGSIYYIYFQGCREDDIAFISLRSLLGIWFDLIFLNSIPFISSCVLAQPQDRKQYRQKSGRQDCVPASPTCTLAHKNEVCNLPLIYCDLAVTVNCKSAMKISLLLSIWDKREIRSALSNQVNEISGGKGLFYYRMQISKDKQYITTSQQWLQIHIKL